MYLSQSITKGNVFLKLENMQFTGSFKFRGASNKINHLTDEQKKKALSQHLLGTMHKVLL